MPWVERAPHRPKSGVVRKRLSEGLGTPDWRGFAESTCKLGHQRDSRTESPRQSMKAILLTGSDTQSASHASQFDGPEDVWRQRREAAMIRACRILEIPYKPEYAEIGR